MNYILEECISLSSPPIHRFSISLSIHLFKNVDKLIFILITGSH